VEGVLWRGVHCSDSLVERMFGKIACTVGAPADIMEVDGKVEGDCHRQATVSRCFQIGFCILTPVRLVPLRIYRLKRLSRVIT
jgi:hypothetical protein